MLKSSAKFLMHIDKLCGSGISVGCVPLQILEDSSPAISRIQRPLSFLASYLLYYIPGIYYIMMLFKSTSLGKF